MKHLVAAQGFEKRLKAAEDNTAEDGTLGGHIAHAYGTFDPLDRRGSHKRHLDPLDNRRFNHGRQARH